MLESGVRRDHNIAMSTLPGFTLPGDVSASQRYWSEDIIEPGVAVTAKGTIRVPNTPGLGYAVRRDRIEKLTVRRRNWDARDAAREEISAVRTESWGKASEPIQFFLFTKATKAILRTYYASARQSV